MDSRWKSTRRHPTEMTNNKKQQQQQNNNMKSKKEKEKMKPLNVVKKFGFSSQIMPSRDEQLYLKGVMNPFKHGADNRIPSQFPFPTQTFHSCWSCAITTDSSGNFLFVWFPSPLTGLSMSNSSASITNPQGLYNIIHAGWQSCISEANMAGKAEMIRFVDAGLLISNNQTFETIQGYIVCTPFICTNVGPTQGQLSQGAVSAGTGLFTGSASAGLSAPGSFKFDGDELINQEVLLTTRPVAPSAYEWRPVGQNNASIGNSWNYVGGDASELSGDVSGLAASDSLYQGTNCKGMVGWIVSGTGFPASTAVINLEGRYDIEASTAGQIASNNNMLTSSSRSIQSTMSFETLTSHLGGFESMSASVKPFINNAVQTGLKKLPGFLASCLV